MNKVSKEFIEAMKGVLNGEKWVRRGSDKFVWAYNNTIVPLELCVGNGNTIKQVYDGKCHSFDWQAEDLIAEDWHKID